MVQREIAHIIAALVVLTAIIGMGAAVAAQWSLLAQALFFAAIILAVNLASKKAVAYALDADVEHEIWTLERFGFDSSARFKKAMPAGIIAPLVLSVLSLGIVKIMALLTYETRARKSRAAKRFGYYSFSEMTELHNGWIGAAGIVSVLLLSIVAYLINMEPLAKFAIYYAFWNLLPISRLDGTQIFFGSRLL